MAGKQEVVATGRRSFITRVGDRDVMVAPGLRLPGNHPVVKQHPDVFEEPPPAIGTMVCIVPHLTGRGEFRLGVVLPAGDPAVRDNPGYFQAGPVEKEHLPGLAAAAAFNSERAQARRDRDREQALQRRAEAAAAIEARAVELDQQAEQERGRAAALRV